MRLLVVLLATLALGGHAEARKKLRLGATALSGALTPEGDSQELEQDSLPPSPPITPTASLDPASDLASDSVPAPEEEVPQTPSTSKPTKTSVLHILTDFGEETDDEAMATAACKIALTNPAMELNIVFLDEEPVSQLATLRLFLDNDWAAVSSATNVKFYRSHTLEKDVVAEGFATSPFSGSFNDLATKTTGEKQDMTRDYEHYVLQVGPVHAPVPKGTDIPDFPQGWNEYRKSLVHATSTYSYALLGLMGETLNSQKDAQKAAEQLFVDATSKAVVDTAKGNGAFKFTYKAMDAAFPGKKALLKHIVKIGFRNTVGRANSAGGRYVANLVATQESSANFQTVKAVEAAIPAPVGVKQAVSKEDQATIAVVVDSYYNGLVTSKWCRMDECDTLLDETELGSTFTEVKGTCKKSEATETKDPIEVEKKKKIDKECGATIKFCLSDNVDPTGKLNVAMNPTKEMVKEGYTYILTTLKEQFDVPIDFVLSGAPGNWEQNWGDVDKPAGMTDLKFVRQYSTMTDVQFDAAMRKSFKKWNVQAQALALPMTPNYDSVGLIYILNRMEILNNMGLEWVDGLDIPLFKNTDMKKNIWQLNSIYVEEPSSFGHLLGLTTKAVAAAAAAPSPSPFSSPEAAAE